MPARRLIRWAATAAAAVVVVAAVAILAVPGPILRALDYSAANERLVTGMLVAGTAERPVIFVSSSDPRTGKRHRQDRMMDTNSGVVSRLELTPSGWMRRDLVRGLPRSRFDHATNGLALDAESATLYVAQGSNTNRGAPSRGFGSLPESPLTAAVLALDLERLGDEPYDLETPGDGLFGGRGGANFAVAPPGGPVRVVATGLRNVYDLVVTRDGDLFATVNGANRGWGDRPAPGDCSDAPREGGARGADMLVRVREGGFYGHPNPARGECGPATDEPIRRFRSSSNGIAELPSGPAEGSLAVVSLDGLLHRVRLAPGGEAVSEHEFVSIGGVPLDVTVQGGSDPLPGTIWVAQYGGRVAVLEPVDFGDGSPWRALPSSGVPRQEVSYVEHDGRLYLAGGGTAHQAYDLEERRWVELAPLPEALDHIQGVVVDDRILYIGGLSRWPDLASAAVHVYDPAADRFSRGPDMARPRGAGGVAVHDGKVYYAGGLSEGRVVPWLDVLDPRTGEWERLPDMPEPRDHFQAVFAGDRLLVTGGRRLDIGTEVAETVAYSVSEGRWLSLEPIPTPRGGFAAALVKGEVVVVGGEVPGRALAAVEAYDPARDRWRTLPSMPTPRHGIQAAVCGDTVFVAAGGAQVGGGAAVDTHEALDLGDDRCGSAAGSARETPGTLAGGYLRGSFPTARPSRPTAVQVGPDGRLYVAEQSGSILAYTIRRHSPGAYEVVASERIDLVRELPNHDDDGSSATDSADLVRLVLRRLGV